MEIFASWIKDSCIVIPKKQVQNHHGSDNPKLGDKGEIYLATWNVLAMDCFFKSLLSTSRLYNSCLKSNNRVCQVKDMIIRPSLTGVSRDYSTNKCTRINNNTDTMPPPRLSNLKTTTPLLGATYLMNHRFYSSSVGSRGDDVVEGSGSTGPEASGTNGFDGNDLLHKVKDAFGEMSTNVQQLLDTHRDTIVPVAWTIAGTFAAWAALPTIFRRLHKYSTDEIGPSWAPVPYEKSVWGALQDPVRYLIVFTSFLQIGLMVAPTTILPHFTEPVWKGAAIISLIWFLQGWKTNIFTRGWAMKLSKDIDRDKLRKLNELSSASLLMFGGMLFDNSLGVLAPVQYVLTAGAAVTAFASVNILRDVLGGLNVHSRELFSVGDTIQIRYLEGEVLEIGLTTTKLLLDESLPPKFVPNSWFNSKAFLITSKPLFRDMVSTITLQVDDIEKIRQVSEEIMSMMRSHANVFTGEMQPYCNPSAVGRHRLELTFGCTLKHFREERFVGIEQDVIRRSREIMKKHGASATVVKIVPSICNDDWN